MADATNMAWQKRDASSFQPIWRSRNGAMTGLQSRRDRRLFSGIAAAGGKSNIPRCCRRAANHSNWKTSKLSQAPALCLSTESDLAVNSRAVRRLRQSALEILFKRQKNDDAPDV